MNLLTIDNQAWSTTATSVEQLQDSYCSCKTTMHVRNSLQLLQSFELVKSGHAGCYKYSRSSGTSQDTCSAFTHFPSKNMWCVFGRVEILYKEHSYSEFLLQWTVSCGPVHVLLWYFSWLELISDITKKFWCPLKFVIMRLHWTLFYVHTYCM